MKKEWTAEQKSVIRMRGKNLLVSAAAGSGKTAVLVERILSLVTDPDHPIDLDQLLVVTFTRAAAGEMKERIGAELEKRIAADPENVHLQRQGALLQHAQISTIHGFCTFVIQNYFQRIGLDPSYRVADENELDMLKRDVLGDVIEAAYAGGRPGFRRFAEAYAAGKSDDGLEKLALQVYEKAVSEPWPEEWLDRWRKSAEIREERQLEQTEWMQAVLAEAENRTKSIAQLAHRSRNEMQLPEAPACYEGVAAADAAAADALVGCHTYQEYQETLQSLCKEKLPARKLQDGEDPELKEQIKNRHGQIWKLIEALRDMYFPLDETEILQELRDTAPYMEELVQLVLDFKTAFDEEKRKKNLCDFSDLEHFALQILLERGEDGTLRRTEAACELSRRYEAVMIDEYQDSNSIQEVLLAAVSGVEEGRNNRFMVGDIKQSIYGFREARPDLFLEKYHTYMPWKSSGETQNTPADAAAVEEADAGQENTTVASGKGDTTADAGQTGAAAGSVQADTEAESRSVRVDLFQNFRSRRQVLDTVNALFRKLMVPELGGITYDDHAALHFGASYFPDCPDQAFPQSELLLLDKADQEFQEDHGRDVMIEAEARMTAARIRKIQREGMVWDQKAEAFRRPRWSDFAVLLRSVSGWADTFVRVFNEEGIPAYSISREGYFSATEVVLVLNYLRILDNPRQEIPFAAVLHSPIAGLTDREMAVLKIALPESPVYEAAERFGTDAGRIPAGAVREEELSTLRAKLDKFWAVYRELRKEIPYTTVHDLILQVLDRTGFGDYAAAMPAGEQRKANLDMLAEKAFAFEQMGNHGLFSFIRRIERMSTYKIDEGEVNLYAENEEIVRVTTIHKSKGLEFPIVFVCGLGKQFNQSDQSGPVLLHARLGIGLEDRNLETRVKRSTFQRSAIALQNSLENKAEELRVLYVALTRAKEKLILTGVVPDAAKISEPLDPEESLSYSSLVGARCYLDWILMARPQDPAVLRMQVVSMEELHREEKLSAQIQKDSLQELGAGRGLPDEEDSSSLAGNPDREAAGCSEEEQKQDPSAAEEQNRERTGIYQALRKITAFQYPFQKAADLPAKLTVSDIKKASIEVMEEEKGEELYPAEEVVPYVPAFMRGKETEEEENASGAARGTVYHHFLQTFDYAQLSKSGEGEADVAETVRKEKARMLAEGILLPEDAACLRETDLVRFLSGNLGKRMSRAAREGVLCREQPFVLDVPAEEINETWPGSEKILVQGTIDAYFEEEGSLVLVDYKTDRIRTRDGHDLAEKYQAQIRFYQRALEQITGRPVKEKYLYSFALGREIPV